MTRQDDKQFTASECSEEEEKEGEDESINDDVNVCKMPTKHFSDKRDMMLMSLSHFYDNRNNISRIIPIINGESDISLRLLDWFVTNYSKKHNIILVRKPSSYIGQTYFNVYSEYRKQLKSYNKQHFDPFRRKDRIKYYYEPHEYVETTIGQLTFFKWVLEEGILDYIACHMNDIEEDMMKSKTRVPRSQQLEKQKEGSKELEIMSVSEHAKARSNAPIKHAHLEHGHEIQHHQADKKHTTTKRGHLSKGSGNHINHITGCHVVRFD